MNSNLKSGLLFLDVRKAFDILNHHILLLKLGKIGLGNLTLNWFKSYLDWVQPLGIITIFLMN